MPEGRYARKPQHPKKGKKKGKNSFKFNYDRLVPPTKLCNTPSLHNTPSKSKGFRKRLTRRQRVLADLSQVQSLQQSLSASNKRRAAAARRQGSFTSAEYPPNAPSGPLPSSASNNIPSIPSRQAPELDVGSIGKRTKRTAVKHKGGRRCASRQKTKNTEYVVSKDATRCNAAGLHWSSVLHLRCVNTYAASDTIRHYRASKHHLYLQKKQRLMHKVYAEYEQCDISKQQALAYDGLTRKTRRVLKFLILLKENATKWMHPNAIRGPSHNIVTNEVEYHSWDLGPELFNDISYENADTKSPPAVEKELHTSSRSQTSLLSLLLAIFVVISALPSASANQDSTLTGGLLLGAAAIASVAMSLPALPKPHVVPPPGHVYESFVTDTVENFRFEVSYGYNLRYDYCAEDTDEVMASIDKKLMEFLPRKWTHTPVALPTDMETLFKLMNTPQEFQKIVISVMNHDKSTTGVLPIVAKIIQACFSDKSAKDLVQYGNELREDLGTTIIDALSETLGPGFENKVNIERFSLELAAQVIMHYATTNDNGCNPSDNFSQRNDSNGCVRTHIRSVGRYLASEYRRRRGDLNAHHADYQPPRMALVDMIATTLRKPNPDLGEGDEVLDKQVEMIAQYLNIEPDQFYVIDWAVSCLSAVIYAKHNNRPQPMLVASHPALKRWFGMTGKLGTRSFSTGLVRMCEAPHGEVLLLGQQLYYKSETRARISQSLVNFWGPIIDLPADFVSEIAEHYGREESMTDEALEDLRLAKQAGCKKTGKMRSDAAFYYAVAIEAEFTPEEALDCIDAFLGPKHRSLYEGSMKGGAIKAEAAFLYAALIDAGSTSEAALVSIGTRLGPKHRSSQEGILKSIKTQREKALKDIDYRKVGVYHSKGGNWYVKFRYQGKNRSIGTYATQDDAAKANKAARNFLEESRDVSLSAKEIKANIKLAKEAAVQVVTPTTIPRDCESYYRKVGVRQVKGGNWSVQFLYQGKERTYGTYATQDEAAKANEAARKFLEESKGLSLSAKEIEANIKLAKAAAAAATAIKRKRTISEIS